MESGDQCNENRSWSRQTPGVLEGGGSAWRVFVSHNVEQVSREVASGAHADGPTAGLQPHFVSFLQMEHRVPWWQVLTSLINLETAQHHLAVMLQVHVSHADEGRDEEAELVDTGDDTCEHACRCVVMVLLVVDDLTETNDSIWGWVVLAQADGEGRMWLCSIAVMCWWSRRAWGSYGTCRGTKV